MIILGCRIAGIGCAVYGWPTLNAFVHRIQNVFPLLEAIDHALLGYDVRLTLQLDLRAQECQRLAFRQFAKALDIWAVRLVLRGCFGSIHVVVGWREQVLNSRKCCVVLRML